MKIKDSTIIRFIAVHVDNIGDSLLERGDLGYDQGPVEMKVAFYTTESTRKTATGHGKTREIAFRDAVLKAIRYTRKAGHFK